MNRRAFVTLLGSAAAWPLAARAQQAERVGRVGVLMPWTPDDLEGQARVTAFIQGMQQLGWSEGHNIRIDRRWATSDPRRMREYATELIALAPEVIFATGSASVGPLLQLSNTVPIVFAIVPDPVGSGFVDRLGETGRQRHRFYLV